VNDRRQNQNYHSLYVTINIHDVGCILKTDLG